MKNNRYRTAVIVFLELTFMSAVSWLSAETLYVVNSQSRTLSRIDTSTDQVNNSFATLGNVPNKIVADPDIIWAVNSGDNAIQKISASSGATLGNIFIGNGVNPWDAIRHQNHLYVTGLFTGKVYKIDTQTGAVVGNINVGTAPEALHVIGEKLYVSNAGNYSQNYLGSSVAVVDLASFTLIKTIPVSANPQYLASYNGILHVSCTGNWTDIGGAVCVIDPVNDELIQTIALGGTPGRIWISNDNTAYIADSNGQYLFSYNPLTYEILNGSTNPLPNGGSEITGNSSMIAVLAPNWSGNGTLKILYPDLSPWKQYTVALMPTDLKMGVSATSSYDAVESLPALSVWPNPVRTGSKISFSASGPLYGEINVYNLKGQKFASIPCTGSSSLNMDVILPCGIYLYRVDDHQRRGPRITGRFVVVK